MDARSMEFVKSLDQQLASSEPPPAEQEAVAAHLMRMQQLRQEWTPTLLPKPSEASAALEWDRQVEMSLAAAAAADREQNSGLEAAWQAWVHREELKSQRSALLCGYKAERSEEEDLDVTVIGSSRPQLQELLYQQQLQQRYQQQYQHQSQEQQQHLQLFRQPQQPQWLQHRSSSNFAATRNVGAAISWANAVAGGEGMLSEQNALHGSNEGDCVLTCDEAADTAAAAMMKPITKRSRGSKASAAPLPPQPQPGEPVPPGHKQCRKCHFVKTLNEFYRSKANSDGHDGRCKMCDAVQCVERRRKKARIDNPTVEEKSCHKCHEMKSAKDFYRNRTNKDGLYNNCKLCFTANSQRRQQNLPHIDDRMADSKKCRRCELEKPAAEFYKNRLMLDGLYSHCKACYQASAAQRVAHRPPRESKACRRCDITKVCSEFYKSKVTTDGLQGYCKTCYKIAAAHARVKKLQEEQNGDPTTADEQIDVEGIGSPRDTRDDLDQDTMPLDTAAAATPLSSGEVGSGVAHMDRAADLIDDSQHHHTQSPNLHSVDMHHAALSELQPHQPLPHLQVQKSGPFQMQQAAHFSSMPPSAVHMQLQQMAQLQSQHRHSHLQAYMDAQQSGLPLDQHQLFLQQSLPQLQMGHQQLQIEQQQLQQLQHQHQHQLLLQEEQQQHQGSSYDQSIHPSAAQMSHHHQPPLYLQFPQQQPLQQHQQSLQQPHQHHRPPDQQQEQHNLGHQSPQQLTQQQQPR